MQYFTSISRKLRNILKKHGILFKDTKYFIDSSEQRYDTRKLINLEIWNS